MIRRTFIRQSRRLLLNKESSELRFWRKLHQRQGGRFTFNDPCYYQRLMLAIAGENTSDFVSGRVVADFGCGPRGTLTWADTATIRIGIDSLAARYADEFPDETTSHNTVYVTSTEQRIPLPTGFVDVMFSINALDHVKDFPAICAELLRVIKPGGMLATSINIDEKPTVEEPQQLTEESVNRHLLRHLEVASYRVTDVTHDSDHPYTPFYEHRETRSLGHPGILWVCARKPL